MKADLSSHMNVCGHAPVRTRTRRKVASVVLAGVALLVPLVAPPSAHALPDVKVGTCRFVPGSLVTSPSLVAATFTPAIGPVALPSSRTIGLSGSGSCIVNNNISASVAFVATVSATLWSCTTGFAVGSGDFSFTAGLWTPTFSGATVELVNTGGLITMSFTYGGPVPILVGAGEFTDVSGGICALGQGSQSWAGSFAFEDPESDL